MGEVKPTGELDLMIIIILIMETILRTGIRKVGV